MISRALELGIYMNEEHIIVGGAHGALRKWAREAASGVRLRI